MSVILQGNIDYGMNVVVQPRLGRAPYAWGGSFAANNPNIGTDCSGAVSALLSAIMFGPQMTYARQFWTGTFAGIRPGDRGPFGGLSLTQNMVCIASPDDAPPNAVAIIAVRQMADPADSHMIIQVQGTTVEMGGNEFLPNGIEQDYHTNPPDTACSDIRDTDEFNQWFYVDPGTASGPVSTAPGVDYSQGPPSGADIAAAGFKFACRYVTDGGVGLPAKKLTKGEADSLWANGVDVVSNGEYGAAQALDGFDQGVADAQAWNEIHLAAGGPVDRPIYFSVDFDEDEGQDPQIDAYFDGCASVIGLNRVGAYGGYWVIKRLFDAGKITWGWQTDAWSGDPNSLGPDGPDAGFYLDPRAHILQRNSLGYATIDGVQCDQNESLKEDFGQWHYTPGVNEMTPEQAAQLAQVWGALFNAIPSQSPFRALGEGAIWQQHQMPVNDDGMLHPQYVAWAASLGDSDAIQLLTTLAAADPRQYPDRAADISLAGAVLSSVTGQMPGPVPAPVPVPDVTPPPAPAPVPLPPVVPPVASATTSANLLSTVHAVITFLTGAAAVGTWSLEAFGNAFSPAVAAGISSAVLFLGAAASKLVTLEQRISGNSNKVALRWHKKG